MLFLIPPLDGDRVIRIPKLWILHIFNALWQPCIESFWQQQCQQSWQYGYRADDDLRKSVPDVVQQQNKWRQRHAQTTHKAGVAHCVLSVGAKLKYWSVALQKYTKTTDSDWPDDCGIDFWSVQKSCGKRRFRRAFSENGNGCTYIPQSYK